MIDVSVIGAGNLGTSLANALSKKGYKIKALTSQNFSSARKSSKIIGKGKPLTDNVQAAKEGKIVFLCLPDEEIAKVTKELANSDVRWSTKFAFHCSGLLSAEILKPLKERGACTASMHPIQSFSKKETNPAQFEGIYWGLEGEKKALFLAQKIIHQLGGHSLIIRQEDKPLYHAACSMASNFFVVLLNVASSILRHIGLKEEQALEYLLPLVEGTLHNVKEFGIQASLTGPIMRGDHKSVEKHLKALRKLPLCHELYMNLGAQALEIAKRKKLPSQKIKALEHMLGGK